MIVCSVHYSTKPRVSYDPKPALKVFSYKYFHFLSILRWPASFSRLYELAPDPQGRRGTNALRISRPSSVRIGMFCKFGFDDPSLQLSQTHQLSCLFSASLPKRLFSRSWGVIFPQNSQKLILLIPFRPAPLDRGLLGSELLTASAPASSGGGTKRPRSDCVGWLAWVRLSVFRGGNKAPLPRATLMLANATPLCERSPCWGMVRGIMPYSRD